VVKFTLSLKQFEINNTINDVKFYRLTSGGAKSTLITSSAVVGTDTIVFTLTHWCSTSPNSCPADTQNLNFRIEGLKNYATTKPPTIPNSLTVDDPAIGKVE
jgi:hypothetical protein